jgi:hypothetical protein
MCSFVTSENVRWYSLVGWILSDHLGAGILFISSGSFSDGTKLLWQDALHVPCLSRNFFSCLSHAQNTHTDMWAYMYVGMKLQDTMASDCHCNFNKWYCDLRQAWLVLSQLEARVRHPRWHLWPHTYTHTRLYAGGACACASGSWNVEETAEGWLQRRRNCNCHWALAISDHKRSTVKTFRLHTCRLFVESLDCDPA